MNADSRNIVAWIDGVLYAVKPTLHVKRIATVVVMAASLNAHASGPSRGPHGGIAAGMALQASRSRANAAAAQSGNGGSTRSVVDDYQPWAESEMRQFEKAQWQPYQGEK